MQLYEFRSLWILLGEFVQDFMDRHDLRIVAFKRNEIFGQFNLPPAPAALVPLFAPGLLHQDPAHRLGGGCEEMPAIGK